MYSRENSVKIKKNIFVKQVRSVLELAVPAWNSSITLVERQDIERVQKTGLNIMLGEKYISYENTLETVGLVCLENRRKNICLKFAKKAEKHLTFINWFITSSKTVVIR